MTVFESHKKEHPEYIKAQQRFVCEICSVRFKLMPQIVQHMKSHVRDESLHPQHKLKVSNCFVCLKHFSSKKIMEEHFKQEHTEAGDPRKQFKCSECPRSYQSEQSMKSHFKKYHATKCGKKRVLVKNKRPGPRNNEAYLRTISALDKVSYKIF